MAVTEAELKSKLHDLKLRADKRKNSSKLKPTQKHLDQVKENADLLYSDQIKTME